MNAAATAFPATLAMGGTGATSLAAGLIQSNGTVLSTTGFGTGLQLMRTNAGANGVEWWTLSVNLGTQVTGTLALGSVAAPTGTGLATVTGGAWDAAAASVGAGILTFLATPSSANLRGALTDETGTGVAVFNTSPTFLTDVRMGTTPATFGEIRTANNWYWWARDAANGTNVAILGLSASDVIELGVGTGNDITIGNGGGTSVFFQGNDINFGSSIANTRSRFVNGHLQMQDSGADHWVEFDVPGNLGADYTLNVPTLTASDTMAVLGLAQTFSAAQTFSSAVSFGSYIQVGGSTETGDGIQLPNNTWVVGRRAAGGKVYLIQSDVLNQINVGTSGNPASTNVNAGSGFTVNVYSGTTHVASFGDVIDFNKAVVQQTVAIPALNVDWGGGNVFTKSLGAGANTITFSNDADGQTITIFLSTHASGSTVTWPAGVQWPGGTEPTQTATAGAVDAYTLIKVGGVVRGVQQANFS
jgi:hypothetical protein